MGILDEIETIERFHLFMLGIDALGQMIDVDRFILLNRIKKGSSEEEEHTLWTAADLYDAYLNMDSLQRIERYGKAQLW